MKFEGLQMLAKRLESNYFLIIKAASFEITAAWGLKSIVYFEAVIKVLHLMILHILGILIRSGV